jgi:hypothetical protein
MVEQVNDTGFCLFLQGGILTKIFPFAIVEIRPLGGST